MSMNVALIATKHDNGKTIETFCEGVLQTSTDETQRILERGTLEEQLEEYARSVGDRFQDYEYEEFNNQEDAYEYLIRGNKNVPFEIKTRTAEEQLEEHMEMIKGFIDSHKEEGYTVTFEMT